MLLREIELSGIDSDDSGTETNRIHLMPSKRYIAACSYKIYLIKTERLLEKGKHNTTKMEYCCKYL